MSKIGRNDYCPCGSKKKFKKCCLSREITVPLKSSHNITPSEKTLVKTLTDELFQPMRLYYTVHDKARLENCLKHLKCMKYDGELDDWVVEYGDETAKIGLAVSPKKVPKHAQPLIIATIYIEHETTMLVDVRSIERAKKLIEFINKHVPKTTAEITHAAIYNKLITISGGDIKENIGDIDYDEIFNQKNITVIDPEKAIQDANEIAKKYSDKEKRLEAMMQKTQDEAKKPLPSVEKFPVHFYEDGIHSFEMSCRMRQMIAMKHYFGDESYSFYDLTQELVYKNIDKFEDQGGWVKVEKNSFENVDAI